MQSAAVPGCCLIEVIPITTNFVSDLSENKFEKLILPPGLRPEIINYLVKIQF